VLPPERANTFGASTTINAAFEGRKRNGWQDLSRSATRRYSSIWTTHIQISIGRRSISSIGPYDVELYPRGLKKSGFSEASVSNKGNPAPGVPIGAHVERGRASQSGVGCRDARSGLSRTG
jgi:hypothetical protein